MKKINWVNFHTRSFGLFRYWVYIESNKLPFYQKNFGKIFDYTLTVPNGKLIGYHHDEKELQDMMSRIFKVSCKNFKTFEKYSTQIFDWMKDFIEFNEKLDDKILSNKTNKEMLRLFDTWYKKCLYWHIGIYFFFTLEPITTKTFLSKLEAYLKKAKKLDELGKYSEIIMSPEKMNGVALEQKMALEIALNIKQNPSKNNELISKYYKAFRWIPCYDVHDREYDLNYFSEQIKKLLKFSPAELREKRDNLVTDFRSRSSRFKNLIKKIEDTELVELSYIMHSLVYYKDYRDDLRRQAGFASKKFMNELAKRLSLSIDELNYLIPSEIISLLQGEKSIEVSKIRSRMPANYVLRSVPGKIELFIGDDVQKILKTLSWDEIPSLQAGLSSPYIL